MLTANTKAPKTMQVATMGIPVGDRLLKISGKTFTVATSYQIDEHEFVLPEVPTQSITIQSCYDKNIKHTIPLNELIINIWEDNDKAFWNRQVTPKFFEQFIPGLTEIFADETEYDQHGLLISLSDDDSREMLYYFDREMYRREHGVWMANGMAVNGSGELTTRLEYLTEDHYFQLQWCKLYGLTAKNLPQWRPRDYEYGEFRKYQRDVYYLIKKAKTDDDILGLFVAKPKKTGITQLFACYYLNKSTKDRQQQMGIMSKGQDAQTVNMLMYFHAFDGLPPIFKPSIAFRADVEGSISYGEQTQRSFRSKKGMARLAELQNAKPLNSEVYAAKVKAAGFDSPTMSDIWFDEFPKYDTENKQEPKTVWDRNQEAVKFQNFFNGRIWITSYSPEYDTVGFLQAKKIYYDSKLSTIRKVEDGGDGRTITGLICITISALNSYFTCFDKYGDCDMVEAKRLNQLERDKFKDDPKGLQARIRQYCENEREAWSAAGAGSTFNNIRLGEINNALETETMAGGRKFVEGHHEWDNTMWEMGAQDQRPKKAFGMVRFVPLTPEDILYSGRKGDKCRYYEAIPPQLQNRLLRYPLDDWGNIMGPRKEDIEYVCGIDPTDYAAAQEVIQGSKNAMITMNVLDILKNNALRRLATKVIVSEYLDRPDNPHFFYEDVVKKIIFEGCVVLIESNKPWVATQLIEDGLGRWMIVKNKDQNNRYELWKPYVTDPKTGKVKDGKEVFGLVRAGTDEVEAIVRVIARYIQRGDPDFGMTIKSERLLEQLMSFSKERSKFFDLVMAFGWALIALEAVLNLPVEDIMNGYEADLVNQIYSALVGH